jgi:hypothetical protein
VRRVLGEGSRQSRDLAATALLWGAATVRWARDKCRRLARDGGSPATNFGSRAEAASAQRGGFNGTTQAFWGCVSRRPTTLHCSDPLLNTQEVARQTTTSQHETRRRHTTLEPRLTTNFPRQVEAGQEDSAMATPTLCEQLS